MRQLVYARDSSPLHAHTHVLSAAAQRMRVMSASAHLHVSSFNPDPKYIQMAPLSLHDVSPSKGIMLQFVSPSKECLRSPWKVVGFPQIIYCLVQRAG